MTYLIEKVLIYVGILGKMEKDLVKLDRAMSAYQLSHIPLEVLFVI